MTLEEKATLKAKLSGVLEVLKGRSVDEAFNAVQASIPTAERADYKSQILWNFWKAHNGTDFRDGVPVSALGAKRRQLLVGGVCETAGCDCEVDTCSTGVLQVAQPLITAARKEKDLKALSYQVDAGINKLFVLARKEATGSTRNLPFLVYSDLSRLSAAQRTLFEAELIRIAPKLNLLPAAHSETLDLIFIVDELGSGSKGGGGYTPPNTAKNWKTKSARTLVPKQDVLDYAVNRGRGIIGITTNAILSLDGEGKPSSKPELTLIHESGHSVNQNFAFIQPAFRADGVTAMTVMDYAGLKYPRKKCPVDQPNCVRPFASIGEYGAESYSAFFLKPTAMCRSDADPSTPESQPVCTARIKGHLGRSPAFKALSPNPISP